MPETLGPMRVSERAASFTESVIREMTRHAAVHDAVNLAQGFPDFPCPPELKEAAKTAIDGDVNQYAITWGARDFREAIVAKTARFHPTWLLDPETDLTVTCGATEGMIAAMLALVDPGEEVIVFEPFYENYGPDAILSGAVPRYVTLHEPDWRIEEDELRAAFGPRTRAIILNSPHNPTGKVFTRAELDLIAALAQEHDALVLTDDIYEHIVYEGEHIPMSTLPGMAERTVAVNSLSKTYSVTGWRVGWVIAPAPLTAAIRKVHDFLTVGAAAPLQAAGTVALGLPGAYYATLADDYRRRRDLLLPALETAGLRPFLPDGAYYVMVDIGDVTDEDDVTFARRLTADPGVASVPGSSFYSRPELGRTKVRFAFPKRDQTLAEAARRLRRIG
ncbi:MAG TPA: aminotransferase class I/II-fold pyridoxal phosphate-dependent enzyme [Candidatus Limnocylindrales bacterium]|nr:aminotransferase class I/II-fold pyridoxal phosphate-dependent enzyme [Candidatus Limnocylindrales bacterium]